LSNLLITIVASMIMFRKRVPPDRSLDPMSLSFDNRIRVDPPHAKGEATVCRILDATGELLAARGYDALTTNRIAEAAGINIATLYRYYPNKQSILVAMSQRDIRAWLEAATAGVDSIRLGGDWRFEMGQLIAFAAQRRNSQPGGKAMRLAMRLLPELQPFAREEAFVTSSLLANILVSQWELDLAHAQQISRIAYEIANSVLDLSLFDKSPDDQVWLVEAQAAVCRYLAPHLDRERPV
jgi:AcrR family transcriptional regulator